MAVCRCITGHVKPRMLFNITVYGTYGKCLYPPEGEAILPTERNLMVNFFRTFTKSSNPICRDLTKGVCYSSDKERPLVIYFTFLADDGMRAVTYDYKNASGLFEPDGSEFPADSVRKNTSIIAWKIDVNDGCLPCMATIYKKIHSEIEAIRDVSGGKYNLFRSGNLDYSVPFYLLDSIQKRGYTGQDITLEEAKWLRGGTHGEKIRFFENLKDGKYQYDVRSAYASVCVRTNGRQSIFLPLKEGQFVNIENEEFQDKYQGRRLWYGIY